MKKTLFFLYLLAIITGCDRPESEMTSLTILRIMVGDQELALSEPISESILTDRSITLYFSGPISSPISPNSISLFEGSKAVNIITNLISDNKTIIVNPIGALKTGTVYRLSISDQISGANGSDFPGKEIQFKTVSGDLQVVSFNIEESDQTRTGRIVNVPLAFNINIEFSSPVNRQSFQSAARLTGNNPPALQFQFSNEEKNVTVSGNVPLGYLSKYTFSVSNSLKGAEGEGFAGLTRVFYSQMDPTPKFPLISQEELLTKVQEQTFRYFWDFAQPNSGMARERNTSGNLVTVGGSGFGVMAIIVGIERGFISRQQGVERWSRIVDFLSTADRFHGAWPHWLNGNTGATIPFSVMDNGGDLVETAFMIQGLLTVKAFLDESIPAEKSIMDKITNLWHEVEWDWYTRNGQDVLYWHWSPEFQWGMNLPIRGYNESLIVYILAAGSPTHPITKQVYDQGWARQGQMVNGRQFYQTTLPLGEDYGGPLFFAHYSYLGLDPRNLRDQYANYWEQNRNHSLINQAHAIQNPLGFVGYSEDSWGFTASDNHLGYNAHSPTNDLGVITPTAALSSFPFTPGASLKALEFFYYKMGDRLWGEYGFYDAFNVTEEWYADSYLAIDQGPIILMIENYRTGLLWDLLMRDQDLKVGLTKLNFNY